MDSLTHLVLGASIGEVTLGKKIGNKAAIIGALANTLPDFDVFFNFFTNDEILKLQVHRSYTHALFTHVLIAFPLAWLTYRLFKKRVAYRDWYLLWILGLFSHSLLDCCTTYGTQLLLPFTNKLIGFNNIAVVDVFFTLPFLALMLVCLFQRRENPVRIKIAYAGIGYAMVYMLFTIVNKYQVEEHFAEDLKSKEIHVSQLYTSPSLFNNFLWNAIAETDDSLWLGEYSILQSRREIKWVSYVRNQALVKNHPDKHSLDVLLWFSQGKYFAEQRGDTLQFYIVKWGRSDFRETKPERAIIFNYYVYPDGSGWKTGVREPRMNREEFWSAFSALWRRMLDAGAW